MVFDDVSVQLVVMFGRHHCWRCCFDDVGNQRTCHVCVCCCFDDVTSLVCAAVARKVMNWFRMRSSKKAEDNLYTRWEQDNDLTAQPDLGLFDEYLEMGTSTTPGIFLSCSPRALNFSKRYGIKMSSLELLHVHVLVHVHTGTCTV